MEDIQKVTYREKKSLVENSSEFKDKICFLLNVQKKSTFLATQIVFDEAQL